MQLLSLFQLAGSGRTGSSGVELLGINMKLNMLDGTGECEGVLTLGLKVGRESELIYIYIYQLYYYFTDPFMVRGDYHGDN